MRLHHKQKNKTTIYNSILLYLNLNLNHSQTKIQQNDKNDSYHNNKYNL
jgi:hypothetical protein